MTSNKIQIDWNVMFEQYTEGCIAFHFWIKGKSIQITEKVNHKHLEETIKKYYPNGLCMDDFFSFFDDNEILLGVYPTNFFEFSVYAKNNLRTKTCNDLDSRLLANKQAIIFSFDLLTEKLIHLKKFDVV